MWISQEVRGEEVCFLNKLTVWPLYVTQVLERVLNKNENTEFYL